ncbi:hypothetical protein PN441_17290 [Spirulina major CS-329]|uniref:hypothetical protein n=1 Tax=Spirulina TaxID=1154 RepID=UPI00232CE62C|nr:MULTISPECIES: hypothetical protein [Spirulina]MDB9494585.1 hypothetical protein [Spirulina subsalsa CS-330]MDB9504835.1 hypothetical protein [Spirulina major CS-329]
MAKIFLEVDEEIKSAFEQVNPEVKQQLSHFFQLFLQDKLQGKTLTDVMASISDNAQQRGLTPEILAEILADDHGDE